MGIYDQADLYCAAFDYPILEEVDWLLGRYPGVRSVLEPFCGQARYAHGFVSRGVRFVGIDLSAEMLARAPRGERIKVFCADARDFEVRETAPDGFDLAWCPINSLCHLTDEADVVSHLKCVRRHLAPGSEYVVELAFVRHDGPWQDTPGLENRWAFDLADGSEIQAHWQRLRCDLSRRLSHERATFRRIRDGGILEEVEEELTLRMWNPDDLIRVARAGGFAVSDEAVVHREFEPGPSVQLSSDLENSGLNYIVFLRPMKE